MHSVKRRKSSVHEDTGSSLSSITHFRSSINTNHKSHNFARQHLNKNKHVSKSFTKSQSLNSKFPLEKLPLKILDSIMAQLQTTDLMALSETSKKLKTLAQPHIFKSIHINIPTQTKDQDDKINDFTKINFNSTSDEESNATHHNLTGTKTTINTPTQFLSLIYTILTTPSKVNMIHNLTISQDESTWNLKLNQILQPMELQFISIQLSPLLNPEYLMNQMTLFDAFQLVCNDHIKNLRSLCLSGLPFKQFQLLQNCFGELREVVVDAGSDYDDGYEYPFAGCFHLKKLVVHCDRNSEKFLERLGLDLYHDGKLQKLESLLVCYRQLEFNEPISVSWFSFFKQLPTVQEGSKFVFENLRSLKFQNCHLDDQNTQIVEKLTQLIDFKLIEVLNLGVLEYSHKRQTHFSSSTHNYNTMLNLLAPHFQNLQKLTIKQTKNCLSCQFQSLIKFLTTTQNLNLTNLTIHTNSLNKSNYLNLTQTLTNYQNGRSLRLSLMDDFIKPKLINNMKSWYVSTNLTQFNPSIDYLSELESQSQFQSQSSGSFDRYLSSSFVNFNELNSQLCVLFWRRALWDFKLVELVVASRGSGCKLFGFNFRVVPDQGLIQVFVGSGVGYLDLVYY
ncbi:unnamed protein product [Ambrosiozyma monospora]|uniref:Unnamed protein product n=1 Tax=Ambrosiozyma monospora TaxID=43982 RepID=A0ACB5SSC5_AMBMO|nr:unnamed protein product [Ambrosiozyma monospora]